MKGVRYAAASSEGIDGVFYCWSRVKSYVEGVEEEFRVCRASEFWRYTDRESSYTEFAFSKYTKPRGYITVSLRSRELFKWGIFELATKLPRYENGPLFWFGFELDDLFGGGVVHYMWDTSRGVLKAFAGGFSSRVEMDLTKYLPLNADREIHLYKIVYRKGLALWYVDSKLRAIALIGIGDSRHSAILYDKKPYTVGLTTDTPSSALPVMLDIDGGDVNREFEWLQLHPWYLRVSEGDPEAQLYLDLHVEDCDEKLSDLPVSEEVVSAPFPGTLDYKELLFAAKGDGVLSLESLAGDQWLVFGEYKVEGNKLYSITINSKNLLYRLRFKSTSRTKIAMARVVAR